MLAVRLYYKCVLCGIVDYVDSVDSSTIQYKYCKKCRPINVRAKVVRNRLGEDVDIFHIQKLLLQDMYLLWTRVGV